MAFSGPPWCDGPDVIGWDWAAVDGEESDEGTTWGEYRVVGTWDDGALTLTEPPGDPVPDVPREGDQSPGPEFATPCPAPDGGWGIVDPDTATLAGRDAANAYATEQPDLGSLWFDTEAELADVLPGVHEQAVLNANFTGDLERHARELRALYGGPLCVSRAPRSVQELDDVQERVHEALRVNALYYRVDMILGRVEVLVPVVDQAALDRAAQVDPEGIVELQGWLQPVP
jgi:hypothetical protein